MEEVTSQIPCRDKQISLLTDLFGNPSHFTPPALFLYGHTATGKSLVVNTLLQKQKLPHVLVNCVECYSQRFLYEHILNQLHEELSTLVESSSMMRCENMNDFVRLLKQVLIEKGLGDQTVYIVDNSSDCLLTSLDVKAFKSTLKGKNLLLVLDKAERLRDMEANILPAFLRLQELTKQNLCVIMISEIVWEKYRSGTGFSEPFVIHFPDYSKGELVQIMSEDCPSEYPADFYNLYVNLVLSIFYYACRNLKELRHLVSINFGKYVHPIKTGEAELGESKKLWKNIEPHLKKALQTLYLREVSSSQWERYQQELESSEDVSLQGLSYRSHVELPFYSKYLLIAAYLASYNPAKSDKKFFAKHSGKGGKKTLAIKKHERTSNHMLGPKPFPLDRLMAIFYSIVEGKVAPTANIFMQISSLVSLHFLGHVSGDDQIEQPRYKCLVSLDFIKSVGRTVNFEVVRYLYDFA